MFCMRMFWKKCLFMWSIYAFFFFTQVYRQDCETFGMVVKMLVAKDPNLEKQLQVPLRENLGEIRERCLEDLKHFISELDEAVRQPEPSVCDSTTPSTALAGHKLSKTGVNHSSSYWHTGLICSVWDRMARLTAEHNGYLGMHFGLLDWTDSAARQPEERHWKNAVLHCIWGWTVLVLNRAFLPFSSLLEKCWIKKSPYFKKTTRLTSLSKWLALVSLFWWKYVVENRILQHDYTFAKEKPDEAVFCFVLFCTIFFCSSQDVWPGAAKFAVLH